MKILAIILCLVAFAGGCKKKLPEQPAPEAPKTESPSPQPPLPTLPQEPGKTVPPEHPKVPSILAELEEAPLDVFPACQQQNCRLILLFKNRIAVLQWQSGEKKEILFPQRFFQSIRSRAPSGKILKFAKGYLILNQDLTSPLYFTEDFDSPPGTYVEKPDWLPVPEPGFNWYTLQDGRFFDFETLAENGLAVIDTAYSIQIARGGKLVAATIRCGATLCSAFPVLYTSSPVHSDEPDAVMKFRVRDDSVMLESTRPSQGPIVDLAVSDLNQDGIQELLVTWKGSKGITIEAMDVF